MVSSAFVRGVLLVTCLVVLTETARAQLLITEIQAINDTTLLDEDRESSDWLEIFNAGPEAVDLDGLALTDDPEVLDKWMFPPMTIASGRFLVVFASGKDRRDPDAALHTNFRLDGDGEPLFLIADGVNVVAGFPPEFPPQVADASWGLSTNSTVWTLLEENAPLRFHVPTDDGLGANWVAPDFDDGAWTEGTGGIGFENSDDFEGLLGTDVGAVMEDVNSSIYVRIPFDVDDPSIIDTLRLRARFDDGFAIFLNGARASGRNDPDELTWDSRATRSSEVTSPESIDISAVRDALRPGRNVLAVQGLNRSTGSNDFLLSVQVQGIDIGEISTDSFEYFAEPTPGEVNPPGFAQIAPPPDFSHDEGAYVEAQDVSLTTDLEGAVIRYTRSSTLPDEASDAYVEPIHVNAAIQITARVFHPEYLPSVPVTKTFVLIDSSIQSFTSNIPVAIATTFGRPIPNNCEGGYTPGFFLMLEPGDDGRTSLTSLPTVAHRVGFRRRGSSTCGRQKFSFNVETWNAESEGTDVEFFGWPAHEDFAMYGPYNFDLALMRNAFIYEISRQVGQYAPRTRFVECYLHTRNGPVTNASFWGVYVFMERNKIGEGRVDIDRVEPSATEAPGVTGGYLLKVDRNDGVATFSGGGQNIVPVQPKVLSVPQRSYLTGWLNDMRRTLNPNTVFEEDGVYVDIRSWIDHHILNMYPMNVDAFRLSGYFFKPRNGPLVMGPIWDYDRTMGSTDGRDTNPVDWVGGGTNFFTFGWYAPLFQSRPPVGTTTVWGREYRARWRELRAGPLSDQNINGVIDSMADELNEAQARNFARWTGVRPRFGGFQGEVDHLKNWLNRRGQFIDSQLTEPPTISPPGGDVEPGAQVELALSGVGEIYYTLDDTDPRGADARPSASAILYDAPITILANTRVTARARQGALWSESIAETYVVERPRLTISEFMYHPPDPTLEEDPNDDFSPTDMEFLEVKNVGAETIVLDGFRFSRGVTFDFSESSIAALAPGEVAFIVRSVEGFTARYGANARLAGEYRGSLSDRSETIILAGPLDIVLAEVDYEDSWYPETDGEGLSLVNADPAGSGDLSTPERWRPSDVRFGTPGVDDSADPGGGQMPGDIDQDGRLTINDASRLLLFLFSGEPGLALPCGDGTIGDPGNQALLDSDGSETVTVSDAVRLLTYLFQRGSPPALGRECVAIAGCPEACAP